MTGALHAAKAREKYAAEHPRTKLIPFAGKDADPIIAMRDARWAKPPALIDELEEMLATVPPRRRCLIAQLLLTRVQNAAAKVLSQISGV